MTQQNKKETLMQNASGSFLDLFVHGAGIILTDIVSDLNHFHCHCALPQGDLNAVTGLDLVAGFGNLAVDRDAPVITGFVGNGAALDQPGNLQVFIQPHLTSRQRPSGSCLP